jgi:hypothetical protein
MIKIFSPGFLVDGLICRKSYYAESLYLASKNYSIKIVSVETYF